MDNRIGEHYEELARRLISAVKSMQMGVSLDYYYRTYAKSVKVPPEWIKLAKELDEAVRNTILFTSKLDI